MITPLTHKWLKVIVFFLTTEDSTLTAEGGRTNRSYTGTNRPVLETAKALFWISVAILIAFLTAQL